MGQKSKRSGPRQARSTRPSQELVTATSFLPERYGREKRERVLAIIRSKQAETAAEKAREARNSRDRARRAAKR